MKKILPMLLCMFLCTNCFAQWVDKEMDSKEHKTITVEEMKKELCKTPSRVLYVRQDGKKEAVVYTDTQNAEAVAKLIAINLEPNETTYVYVNHKKLYKDISSRFRYYAGRYYNFNNYRIVAEKEGPKEIDGKTVYRMWLMKVDMPKKGMIYGDYPVLSNSNVMIGVCWPAHHN